MQTTFDPALLERMIAVRRDLHRHPELSWQEHRTCEQIASVLSRLEIPHRRVLETGILADLPGPPDVPIVAIRADVDALPIHEETELPFASENDGIMHACGHDGHTSMVLGAAELLRGAEGRPAPVRLIFQPAEERGSGAKAMIEAGALDGVGVIFGGHLDRHYDTGELIVTEGPVNASTDDFKIRITGQGAHAARPHEAVDAVVIGSLMVMSIQTIVSREVNPAFPSVVSVGRFRAGTVSNAIAGQAELDGTIRAQHVEVREQLRDAVTRIADSTAALHGAAVDVTFREGTPPVINTSEMAGWAREAATRVVPAERVGELKYANMGGEDFAYYLEKVPGCFIRIGARVPGREGFPAHSSKFDFDEQALAVGAAWFQQMALVAADRVSAGGG